MQKMIHRENYRLIQKFLEHQARNISKKSADRYRFYLRHLLLWAMDTPLTDPQKIQPDFNSYVANIPSPTGGSLAHESEKKIFNQARQFFLWAKLEYPAEFKAIDMNWIDNLHETKRHNKLASNGAIDLDLLMDDSDTSEANFEFVNLQEVHTLADLPKNENDLAHWRDFAMAAFLYLTGARANAAVTIPIGAVHFDKMRIRQWTNLGVKTKNDKSATTFMHNIPELIEVAQSWDTYARARLPLTSPWYAPINNQWGDQSLSGNQNGKNRGVGLDKRLRILFAEAGLPYKSAHKFRHGHAVFGLERCRTMADYKAVSLNLMHDNLLITDSIYVHMLRKDVGERIHALTNQAINIPGSDLMEFLNSLSEEDKKDAFIFLAKQMAGRR